MKSLKRFKVLLGLALVSSLALGAAASGSWSGIDLMQRWMKGGFYAGSAATGDTKNKVTRMLSTTCDYDFPAVAIGTGPAYRESWGCTLTGVKVEDPCFSNKPLRTLVEIDGGADSRSSTFGCYASAADTIKITHTPAPLADGGEGPVPADPVDAGYQCRCISNQ